MRETHFNDDEQVTDYVRRAYACVLASDVPSYLHNIAFTKALELISAKQVTVDAHEITPTILGAAPLPGGKLSRGH